VSVFIQAGSGGLTGFVDDTLKGKSYSAVSANIPTRSGLDQLQRVLAALFVEGKDINLSFLGITPGKEAPKGKPVKLELGSPIVRDIAALKSLRPVPTKVSVMAEETPVLRAFIDNCDEISAIQEEIIALFNQSTVAPPKRLPVSKDLDISLENTPYLIDHALLRQKPGWHCADDMDPVIPMTMIFELLADIAAANAPGTKVKSISQIQVFQWMNVATPFRATVIGQWQDPYNVSMSIDKYANALVTLSEEYTIPPQRSLQSGKSLGITRSSEEIYEQHMFHGPAYQGIRKIVAVGDKGITGIIESSSGKGSLLDNAGQLFGLWLQLTLQKDRIAFPVKIQEVAFYGDMEDQSGVFECTCELTDINDDTATADFILKRDNKVWAIITGWQNARLEIDEPLWKVSMAPLHNSLSEEIVPGVFLFRNTYQRVVSWDFIMKRYFNQTEKADLRAMLPNKRKERIISRVAVKDAVRALLKKEKQEAYYPIEFEIRNDDAGKPFPEGTMTNGIHVSLAHKDKEAVAIARSGTPVGIDIEVISEKNDGFNELVFNPEELALIPTADSTEWIIRCWVAKEAYGKYLGKGLQGNPRKYKIDAINGNTLTIGDVTIQTIKHNNYIIGWTL